VRLSLAVAALLLAALVTPASAQQPGCPPGTTGLGGSLLDDPRGGPVNALVGIELTDTATGRAYDVFTDGRVDTTGRPAGQRYSVVDDVNRAYDGRSLGSSSRRLDRTWGAPRGPGHLCFTSNPRITQAFVEVYPRRPVDADGDGRAERTVTDRSRVGAAAHYRQPVPTGGVTTVALRLPERSTTGFLHGYVTHAGRSVPVAPAGCGSSCVGITTVRAFPYGSGPDCGIEGFSASADGLDPTAAQGTYYRIDALAGGRCGAPDQSYALRVTCAEACGPGRRVLSADVRVVAGRGTQTDLRS
jgi:hypothetical protein